MNISLIQFAVQSIIRLGKVSREAADQHARNTAALLPGLDSQVLERIVIVNGFFTNSSDHKAYVADDQPLAEFWDGNRAKTDKISVDSLYVAALQIGAAEGVDFSAALTPSGAMLIEQFDPGKGPLSPFARVALTAADVVLDYLAIDPGIATDNPNSQKLIGAFARNMADFLPDDGDYGAREKFGERLATGFLRAGLATISAHPDWVVNEEHIEKLLENSLQPVLQKFPTSIADRIQWNRVTETIVGPAAQAALKTVAANQSQFFGGRFDSDLAVGAVTQALLLEAAEDGLQNQFTQDSLIGMYEAVLGVAATRPDLFVEGDTPQEALARDALKNFAGALAKSPPPFDKTTGITLASIAVDVMGANAHRFADPKHEWQGVAVKVFQDLTKDLAKAVKANKGLEHVLSREQFTDIGRTVLLEISTNPTLITKSGNEWRGVIAAVSSAMAADKELLLTADDWKAIAGAAAAGAAANPARLFKLGQNPKEQLASQLFAVLLKGASDALKLPHGKDRSVLSGTVLREVITIAFQTASGNAKAVEQHLPLVESLVAELNKLTVNNHLEIGSKEWLHLFRALLGSVLDGTPVGDLGIDRAVKLLQGG